MKIIIDENNGFNGEVNPNEAKITCNPKTPLYTTDLTSCIGLGLIEKTSDGKVRRGLAKMYCKGDVVFEEDDSLTLTEKELKEADEDLKKFISYFKEPRAILVYTRFKQDNNGDYENPLAKHLTKKLLENHVLLYLSDAIGNKHLIDHLLSEDPSEIYYKNFGLHHNRISIMHMGRPMEGQKYGRWLNRNNTDLPLDLNF